MKEEINFFFKEKIFNGGGHILIYAWVRAAAFAMLLVLMAQQHSRTRETP